MRNNKEKNKNFVLCKTTIQHTTLVHVLNLNGVIEKLDTAEKR